ncbi:hypothetical protein BJF85_23670 [Saccharomonospora sp. CUA-673]|uniref:hypothetical protein n=1 Tax=Saccharomonospora sp. CUA-673 TaxID=1904969 RepID=UPI0009676C06|nr:hypothetical protein [Saccharomonospora sp. CUA-673]OLT41567.1 hypothetical protein BJF85_23670 [Saccharomonospora sp. CUA-673]
MLPAAEQLGDPAMLARAHAMQGRSYYLAGLTDRAKPHLDEADRQFAAIPDRWRLRSSLFEFWGRYHQIRGRLDLAAGQLHQAVRIDREHGDHRALLIHARMLAAVLSEAGRPAEAWPLLDEAAAVPRADARNLARVHMVRGWTALRAGYPADATYWAGVAHAALGDPGTTAYGRELSELRAEIATVTGPADHAAGLWAGLAHEAMTNNHPKAAWYIQRSEQCRR